MSIIIIDPNITTKHDVHEEEFNTHRLLAVCTDTWYLIACIIDRQKMEEHLSDLFTLAYDIDLEQSQDTIYEELFLNTCQLKLFARCHK